MSLALRVDAERWRAHLRATVEAMPAGTALVPVIKGNGYGFGNQVLAAEAARLGVRAVAVGTYAELPAVERAFPGDLLVLEPWRPDVQLSLDDRRVIHTVSRESDLARLTGTGARAVLEQLTSMRRFGFDVAPALTRGIADVSVEGVALHLPMAGDGATEAGSLAGALRDAGPQPPVLWISHLTGGEAGAVRALVGSSVHLRVGTALWLGDRAALHPRATVLEVHPLTKGTTFGYRQRRAPRDGHLVLASGGTAHGIALEAPKPVTSLRSRVTAAALGGLEALGRNLSPYRLAGKRLWFAEPPHMQVSMLWLPGSTPPPAVGDELDVEVRYTTTTFDEVTLS
jgi:hypothetical protein